MTTAYPGVVDTRICCQGYNAEAAGVSGRKEDGAMTVQECARLIITGLSRRQRDGNERQRQAGPLHQTDGARHGGEHGAGRPQE